MDPARNSPPGASLLAKPVFTAGTLTFYWSDVALAGWMWDDWKNLEEQARQRSACLEHLEAVGEDEALADEIQEAANEFRYSMNLIAADETVSWLSERGLTADDWTTYIKGAVLRRRWEPELVTIVRDHPISDRDVDDAIWVDAICGGWLTRWAEKLAGRVAVGATSEETDYSDDGPADAEKNALLRLVPSSLLRHRPSLQRSARLEEQIVSLVALERTFGKFRRKVVVAKAVDDHVQTRYLDWMRIEGHMAIFRGETEAREALLCASEDGQSLHDVAHAAGTEARETSLYLGDIAEGLRPILLAARPGEIIGPFEWDRQMAVLMVRRKVAPTSEDDDVRRRAEGELVRRALDLHIAKNVHWRSRL